MPYISIGKAGDVMGKNLKGKELGKGLYQRKGGRYEARIFVRGTGKTFSIYGTNLQHVKKERNAYLANISPGIVGYDPRISVSKWYEKCLNLYVYDSHRFLEACKNTRYFELFFLLHTGLRIGEALALEWCDLDFKRKKIRVYKTLNRVTKYYDSKGNKLSERYSTVQITTPKKSQEISGEILIHF